MIRRSIATRCATAFALLSGCEQVAGVTQHELDPGTDAGAEAASPDAGAGSEPDVNQNPWADVAEKCNFIDDNHDGSCDEGFDWTIGPWKQVYSGSAVQSVAGVRLPDGRVVALVQEGTEPGSSSHAALVTLDADGSLRKGPTDVWNGEAIAGAGIAATLHGEVGVGVKPAGQSCDAGSCPIAVHRFGGYDLSTVGNTILERSANHPDVIPTQRLHDLAWTGAGYVALAEDTDGFARLVWENPLGTSFAKTWNGLIDETLPYSASLAVGPLLGYGIYRNGLGGQQEVVGGMSSLGSYKQVLRPVVAITSGGGLSMIPPGGRKSAAWSGSDLIVMAVVEGPTQVRQTRFGRIRVDGQMTMPPGLSSEGYAMAGSDDRILVTTVAQGGFDVVRLRSSIAQVGSAIPVPEASDLAIVATGGVPVLLRVSADRTRVHAAAVQCQ